MAKWHQILFLVITWRNLSNTFLILVAERGIGKLLFALYVLHIIIQKEQLNICIRASLTAPLKSQPWLDHPLMYKLETPRQVLLHHQPLFLLPNANPLELFPQNLPSAGQNANEGTLKFLCNSPQVSLDQGLSSFVALRLHLSFAANASRAWEAKS